MERNLKGMGFYRDRKNENVLERENVSVNILVVSPQVNQEEDHLLSSSSSSMVNQDQDLLSSAQVLLILFQIKKNLCIDYPRIQIYSLREHAVVSAPW